MGTTTELDGIVLDLPEAAYFADDSLSSTGARLLLDSPARFHYAQTHPRAPKDAFDLGSAVHAKVLGTGYEVVYLDFPDWRTNAAKAAREEARDAGQIPMLLKEKDSSVDRIAEAVLAQPVARALFERPGNSEASVFATDPVTGVRMRARFDRLPDFDGNQAVAVDLKTIGKDASPKTFARSVADYGYDTQQAHYLETLSLATGEDIPMVFVVVETAAPHLVGVYQLDVIWSQMGLTKARIARERYAACLASGEWPGFPQEVGLLPPPTWLVYEHEERYA